MQTVIYLGLSGLLIAAAYFIFNQVIAKEYLKRGRLNWWASILQLLVFVAFFSFPYLYMPPEWTWDWLPNGTWNRLAALILVSLGMLVAFGTMFWFGLRRAFGLEVKGFVRTGPYRYTRNPQMVGGWLMITGVFVYLPSLYNLGWVFIWTLIGNWMVTNEEIHLRRVLGEEYEQYCKTTPRYLIKR